MKITLLASILFLALTGAFAQQDLNWDRPMPQDALGFGKFTWPE